MRYDRPGGSYHLVLYILFLYTSIYINNQLARKIIWFNRKVVFHEDISMDGTKAMIKSDDFDSIIDMDLSSP